MHTRRAKPAAHLAIECANQRTLTAAMCAAYKVRSMPAAVLEIRHQIQLQLLRHLRLQQHHTLRVLAQHPQMCGMLVKDFLCGVKNIYTNKSEYEEKARKLGAIALDSHCQMGFK